jgi:hypothetical protein
MIMRVEVPHNADENLTLSCLQEESDEHGQGKWEGKQEGKSDKRIAESKARQKGKHYIVHEPSILN